METIKTKTFALSLFTLLSLILALTLIASQGGNSFVSILEPLSSNPITKTLEDSTFIIFRAENSYWFEAAVVDTATQYDTADECYAAGGKDFFYNSGFQNYVCIVELCRLGDGLGNSYEKLSDYKLPITSDPDSRYEYGFECNWENKDIKHEDGYGVSVNVLNEMKTDFDGDWQGDSLFLEANDEDYEDDDKDTKKNRLLQTDEITCSQWKCESGLLKRTCTYPDKLGGMLISETSSICGVSTDSVQNLDETTEKPSYLIPLILIISIIALLLIIVFAR